jgi:hypothetical protein
VVAFRIVDARDALASIDFATIVLLFSTRSVRLQADRNVRLKPDTTNHMQLRVAAARQFG